MHSAADPCAQPQLMHPDQAIPTLLAQVNVIEGTEVVQLSHALNRVLAEDLASCIDLPPFNNSAMDGYAFNLADLAEDKPLRLIGQSFAGHPYHGECSANTCIRIMTGAPLPQGYDTVQMQEKVRVDGDDIYIEAPQQVGENVRKRGEELTSGAKVLSKGTQIGAAEMGVLATIGASQFLVYRQLKVAFFSTGDELRPVGSELAQGKFMTLIATAFRA